MVRGLTDVLHLEDSKSTNVTHVSHQVYTVFSWDTLAIGNIMQIKHNIAIELKNKGRLTSLCAL
jgi:hypothetical protein